MNTTPLTTKKIPAVYTVAGGVKAGHSGGSVKLSLLLLTRGGRVFNPGFLQEMERLGFQDILCVEGPRAPRDVETLTRRHPTIRFLILREALTVGEQLNLGIQEALGEFVLVLWSDMGLMAGGLSSLVVERLYARNLLCTVPILQNLKGEVLPTLQAPVFHRKYLKVLNLSPNREGRLSLFPYDYSGIYQREKFLLTGGYDPHLKNPYWQKMDFGFRSYMWGEKILCETSLRARYLGEPVQEDTSPDESYKRFYLKNLMVRFNGTTGYIPKGKFWNYYLRTGGGLYRSRQIFREIRQLVELHQFRYKYDAASITDLWEADEL